MRFLIRSLFLRATAAVSARRLLSTEGAGLWQQTIMLSLGQRISSSARPRPKKSDVGLCITMRKATWPALFGIDESTRRCKELFASATRRLSVFGDDAAPLRELATLIVERVK